ncbi:MAG: hypothetical protein E6K81_16260 [Candidatus Eisenbacteria bacterium]|uniref:Uncharacterized protein n=1 Tax=Eiseniibacteriota bacterium TaxID=2212470 RepID=A0A538TYY8_UNCEI|nr:MAG: hypothetical protein E6K81_16260 [Candidatus Eisenbacteria bacterium]
MNVRSLVSTPLRPFACSRFPNSSIPRQVTNGLITQAVTRRVIPGWMSPDHACADSVAFTFSST